MLLCCPSEETVNTFTTNQLHLSLSSNVMSSVVTGRSQCCTLHSLSWWLIVQRLDIHQHIYKMTRSMVHSFIPQTRIRRGICKPLHLVSRVVYGQKYTTGQQEQRQLFPTINCISSPLEAWELWTNLWWGLCRNEDSLHSQWKCTSLLQEHAHALHQHSPEHQGSGPQQNSQPRLHMQEQDAPCSFAWPFSKQLSAKHKRNKNSVGVISKLLSWKHTMPKLIQNIKPYKDYLCTAVKANRNIICASSRWCQTLPHSEEVLTPALANRSRDNGSMPFWLITTKFLSVPSHTCIRHHL